VLSAYAMTPAEAETPSLSSHHADPGSCDGAAGRGREEYLLGPGPGGD